MSDKKIGCTIRKARLEDVDGLIELMRRFYAESSHRLDEIRAGKAFEYIIKNPNWGNIYVNEENEALNGYLATKYYFAMGHHDFVCSIDDLYVCEEYRNRGIARNLIRAAMEFVKGRNIKFFSVDVGTSNQPALKVYEKIGFRERNKDILTMEMEDA